jgi:hypothetical protein
MTPTVNAANDDSPSNFVAAARVVACGDDGACVKAPRSRGGTTRSSIIFHSRLPLFARCVPARTWRGKTDAAGERMLLASSGERMRRIRRTRVVRSAPPTARARRRRRSAACSTRASGACACRRAPNSAPSAAGNDCSVPFDDIASTQSTAVGFFVCKKTGTGALYAGATRTATAAPGSRATPTTRGHAGAGSRGHSSKYSRITLPQQTLSRCCSG